MIVGVVLVGGRSRRMGNDKALLPFTGGSTFLERAVTTLQGCCDEVITVGGERRLPHVDHLPDAAEDAGPLAGVVAALSSGRGDRYLFVSCDAPLVEVSDLAPLLRARGAACFTTGSRLLPLPCGVPSSGQGAARQGLAGEDRSLRSLLVALGAEAIPVDDDVAARLRGVNTPEELAALRR